MYKLIEITLRSGQELRMVKRINDESFIPMDNSNTDYQAYLKWLDGYEEVNGKWVKTSEGNTPLPADE